MSRALTVRANALARSIMTPCGVSAPFDPRVQAQHTFASYTGLWDTGATGTVVTQRVVDDLKLPVVGKVKVHNTDGEKESPVYLANLALPNQVLFPGVRVTVGILKGFDVLIGMDIITTGDFAITNVGGKTVFSFRVPSTKEIDFSAESTAPKLPEIRTSPKVGRNDPCPCGSGKKHKHCHGA